MSAPDWFELADKAMALENHQETSIEDLEDVSSCRYCSRSGELIWNGEFVCPGCGMVEQCGGNFEMKEEGFRYVSEAGAQIGSSRLGQGRSLHDQLKFSQGFFLATKIGGKSWKARKMNAINRNISSLYTDQRQIKTEDEIQQRLSPLNLNEETITEINLLWNDLLARMKKDGATTRGKPRLALMGVTVLSAMGKRGRTLESQKISELFGVERKKIGNAQKIFEKYYGSLGQLRASDLIPPLSLADPKWTSEVKMNIIRDVRKVQDSALLRSTKPKTIAAAVCLNLPWSPQTQAQILSAFSTTWGPVQRAQGLILGLL